ncbi:hypothetical protein MHYP_G00314210 [Metynnis hypsauchen]
MEPVTWTGVVSRRGLREAWSGQAVRIMPPERLLPLGHPFLLLSPGPPSRPSPHAIRCQTFVRSLACPLEKGSLVVGPVVVHVGKGGGGCHKAGGASKGRVFRLPPHPPPWVACRSPCRSSEVHVEALTPLWWLRAPAGCYHARIRFLRRKAGGTSTALRRRIRGWDDGHAAGRHAYASSRFVLIHAHPSPRVPLGLDLQILPGPGSRAPLVTPVGQWWNSSSFISPYGLRTLSDHVWRFAVPTSRSGGGGGLRSPLSPFTAGGGGWVVLKAQTLNFKSPGPFAPEPGYWMEKKRAHQFFCLPTLHRSAPVKGRSRGCPVVDVKNPLLLHGCPRRFLHLQLVRKVKEVEPGLCHAPQSSGQSRWRVYHLWGRVRGGATFPCWLWLRKVSVCDGQMDSWWLPALGVPGRAPRLKGLGG